MPSNLFNIWSTLVTLDLFRNTHNVSIELCFLFNPDEYLFYSVGLNYFGSFSNIYHI